MEDIKAFALVLAARRTNPAGMEKFAEEPGFLQSLSNSVQQGWGNFRDYTTENLGESGWEAVRNALAAGGAGAGLGGLSHLFADKDDDRSLWSRMLHGGMLGGLAGGSATVGKQMLEQLAEKHPDVAAYDDRQEELQQRTEKAINRNAKGEVMEPNPIKRVVPAAQSVMEHPGEASNWGNLYTAAVPSTVTAVGAGAGTRAGMGAVDMLRELRAHRKAMRNPAAYAGDVDFENDTIYKDRLHKAIADGPERARAFRKQYIDDILADPVQGPAFRRSVARRITDSPSYTGKFSGKAKLLAPIAAGLAASTLGPVHANLFKD